jgi:hypothetical protein
LGSDTYAFNVGGNPFSLCTTFDASYSSFSTELDANPVVTYTGASALATSETIDVDFFQNYYAAGPGNWDGTYSEQIPFELDVDGTASAEYFWDGQGVGLVGPFSGPGTTNTTNSAYLIGLDANTLSTEAEFSFTFAAGSAPGSVNESVSATPEPVETIPLALAMAALVFFQLHRNRQAWQPGN